MLLFENRDSRFDCPGAATFATKHLTPFPAVQPRMSDTVTSTAGAPDGPSDAVFVGAM